MGKYAIGVDFGSASGRVAIVDVATGEVVATDVTEYKHGVISSNLPNSDKALKRDSALQHPQDYLDVLEQSIPNSLKKAQLKKADIIGIGLDFTSCTILPVDESFTPLCWDEKWENEPNAWVKLWKHHAAQEQANLINTLAREKGEKWLKRYGGIISSEWMLPKVLEVLEDSPALYEATAYFLEAGDWLTTLMTGKLKRNSCAAGFKGMWNKQEGYVSNEFLKAIHPKLEHIYETKLSGEVISIGEKAGHLTTEFANRIGLTENIPVSISMIDAHAGVPGAGVTTANEMVLVMGTSTCHIVLSKEEYFVEGISGVVENSIIPDYFAYEGGQAAVGDIFAWFTEEHIPAYIEKKARKSGQTIHAYLESLAEKIPPGSNGLLALDWHNGCRTPLVDADLSGLLIGLTLSTKPEEIYRALIEATAYGTKMIIEQFEQAGIEIKHLIACGGLPLKNQLLMQIYADVTGRPIKVAGSTITPAIGSAIYGAVVAGSKNGGYDSITDAAEKMGADYEHVYTVNKANFEKYALLYREYKGLVNYFGRGENKVMKKLKKL